MHLTIEIIYILINGHTGFRNILLLKTLVIHWQEVITYRRHILDVLTLLTITDPTCRIFHAQKVKRPSDHCVMPSSGCEVLRHCSYWRVIYMATTECTQYIHQTFQPRRSRWSTHWNITIISLLWYSFKSQPIELFLVPASAPRLV